MGSRRVARVWWTMGSRRVARVWWTPREATLRTQSRPALSRTPSRRPTGIKAVRTTERYGHEKHLKVSDSPATRKPPSCLPSQAHGGRPGGLTVPIVVAQASGSPAAAEEQASRRLHRTQHLGRAQGPAALHTRMSRSSYENELLLAAELSRPLFPLMNTRMSLLPVQEWVTRTRVI